MDDAPAAATSGMPTACVVSVGVVKPSSFRALSGTAGIVLRQASSSSLHFSPDTALERKHAIIGYFKQFSLGLYWVSRRHSSRMLEFKSRQITHIEADLLTRARLAISLATSSQVLNMPSVYTACKWSVGLHLLIQRGGSIITQIAQFLDQIRASKACSSPKNLKTAIAFHQSSHPLPIGCHSKQPLGTLHYCLVWDSQRCSGRGPQWPWKQCLCSCVPATPAWVRSLRFLRLPLRPSGCAFEKLEEASLFQ